MNGIRPYSTIQDAIERHSLKEVRTLIREDASIVHRVDRGKKTPLFNAIEINHLPIVRQLIHAHADLNHQDMYGNTPLIVAALVASTEIIHMLFDAGANPNCWNQKGWTPYDCIRMRDRATIEKITGLLLQNNPWSVLLHEEALLRRHVAHVLHLKGTTFFTTGFPELKKTLEGGFTGEWVSRILGHIDSLSSCYPISFPAHIVKGLKDVISGYWAVGHCDFAAVLDKIHSGQELFLEIGNAAHTVFLLTWGNQIVLCNRGQGRRTAIEVYHFNPMLFTKEILEELHRIRWKGTLQEYQHYIFNVMPKKIGMCQTPVDVKIQCSSLFMDQYVGNCSLISLATAIYAYFLVGTINRWGPFSREELCMAPLELVNLRYQIWLAFEQVSSVEEIIFSSMHSRQLFEPDYRMINEAIGRAIQLPLDSILEDRLRYLITAYREMLPSIEQWIFDAYFYKCSLHRASPAFRGQAIMALK